MSKTHATGADLLWRVSDSFTLPVLEVLDDGTYLSHLREQRGRRTLTSVSSSAPSPALTTTPPPPSCSA
ncbi:hypothetical protein [Streptomyces sp. NPDC002845]